jgi:hypothetical protein
MRWRANDRFGGVSFMVALRPPNAVVSMIVIACTLGYEIEPSMFVINIMCPLFVLKSPNPVGLRLLIVVDTSEMLFVPLHGTIHDTATREVELRPGLNLLSLTDLLQAV